jgi:hypothetical protein
VVTTKETVVKTISAAQLNWSFDRGLIWEYEGQLFSRQYEYRWLVPHLDRDGDPAGGHYEVISSELVFSTPQ